MQSGPSTEFPRRRLLDRCLGAQARIVRLIARPGWGKTTFARQLATAYGEFAVVDCQGATSVDELEDRLARGTARGPDCVIVDNVERVADVSDAVAYLREAVEDVDADRRFVIASRVEIAVGAGRAVAPHQVMTLGADDLAFDAAEIREIFAGLGVAENALQRVVALTGGWAIPLFLFARLAREGRLTDALEDLEHPSLNDLYTYAARETLLAWTPDERAGLAAAVAIPQATADEIEAAVGGAARRALEAAAVRLGPVTLVDGRFVIPELATAGVRRFLGAEMARARDRAIRNAVAAGAHLRAAQIRCAGGDYAGAVAEMETLGLYAPGAQHSPSYAALAKSIPAAELLASRNVLLAVLADRETQAKPLPLLGAVERFAGELRLDSDPEAIAGTRTALGALLRMAERRRDARIVLETQLGLADPSPERTAVVTANLAAVVAVAGDVDGADALLARAGVSLEGPTLFPCERFDVEVVRNRLRADPVQRRAGFERNVAAARFAGSIAQAQALRALAAGAWLDGGDAAAAAAIELSNRLADGQPGERRRVRSPRPHLDAPVERYDRWLCVWYTSTALLEDDPETARRFVQVALDGLAQIGEPYLDAIASLVAASLPGDDVPALVARARTDAATIREPAFIAAVEAIVEGRYADAGILLPVARRIERSRATRTSTTRVAVLEGRVLSGTVIVPLRERELELVVALALERRPLTRESLVSRLWPDVTSDEANAALRTAVYRLRKQLGDPMAVVSTAAGYHLAQTIPVDLLEAEQFVTAARRLGTLSERERARLTALLERLAGGLPTVYARWDWFAPYEQRTRDLLHDAGIALAEDDLRRGDTAAALARAETLLRADALDEPANEIAIRAHVAAGRKSEALRRYRRYRDALHREYGVAPDVQLSQLLDDR